MKENSKNNFDAVRIVLALIVFFAHMRELTDAQQFTWFQGVFDANFAVRGFFAISGYLVTKSYLSSDSIADYLTKRARRIYPAYVAAVLFSLFVGVLTTTLTLSDFFTSIDTVRYLASNLLFLNFVQPTLPGALNTNTLHELNSSLWTIKVEVMLYLCVPLLAYLFNRFKSISVAVFALVFLMSTSWVYFFQFVYDGAYGETIAVQFIGQLSYFGFGALIACNRATEERLIYIAVLSVIAIYLVDTDSARVFLNPICYTAVVILAAISAVSLPNFGKYGDVSYGIYLYHFPTIQLLVHIGVFSLNPWLGLGLAILITCSLAFLSWHLIEKKLLRRTSHYFKAAITPVN
jgi:peptidoglycan/LPS O-acetylase OafA/YrhL